MITIGITGAGGGVGQSILHALSQSTLELKIVSMDASPRSIGMFWSDDSWLLPKVSQEESYIKSLLDICNHENLDIIIPGLDIELPVLSRHRDTFLQHGCKVIVGSKEAVSICRDKFRQSVFCREKNLPFVKTCSLEEARKMPDSFDYPVIVKPRGGSASAGASLVFNPDQLYQIPDDQPMIVQDYLPPNDSASRSFSGKTSTGNLDQSNEISVQYYINRSGNVSGSFASVNLLKNGIPVEISPEPDSPAIAAGLPIVKALAQEGLTGPVNLQGRQKDGDILFFEINARFTGITGLRASFGYKEVEAAICDLLFDSDKDVEALLGYLPGYFGLRYVADSIVPVERMNRLCLPNHGKTPSRGSSSAPSSENILVTGASGYFGAAIIEQLLDVQKGHTITALARTDHAETGLVNTFGNHNNFACVRGEFPGSIPDLQGMDTVIHAASLRPGSDPSPLFLTNTDGTRALLEAMHDAGVGKLIFISSQSVYGTARTPLWKEEMPAKPETPYALSKWIGELLSLSENYSIPQVIILRVARIYGLGHFVRWDELPHKFALNAAKKRALPLFGSKNRIDLLHVNDAARAVRASCCTSFPETSKIILNIGSGTPVSISDFASICQAASRNCGLPAPPIEQNQNDEASPLYWGMDIRKAKESLGWVPRHSLQSGMEELIRYQLDNAE